MPKSKRDLLKRAVAQAANHIEEAQIDLLGVKEAFAPVHPDHAQLLDGVVGGLETMLQLIVSFCYHAWGTSPSSWQAWRNPGTHNTDNGNAKTHG